MADKKTQKRQFWVIWTIVFLGFIGISIPYLVFPPIFLNAAYSFFPADWSQSSRFLFLGFTLAAYPIGQFVGSPILGALSDDYGRKSLLAVSLCLAALCNLASGFSIAWQHLGLLIVSRFAAGFMEGNVAIARAMVADLKTLAKHETFGKMNAGASVAYLIGPFFGGLMADKSLSPTLTPSTPFYFICVLFFALAMISSIVLKAEKSMPSDTKSWWERIYFIKRMTRLFANKQLKYLMIASTVFTLAVDIFYEFGPIYLTVKWSLGPAQLILYNGVLCLGLAIGNGWLPTFLSRRKSMGSPIFYAIGGFAALLLGIAFVNSTFWMGVFFTIIGLTIGVAVTFLTVKISDSASDAIQGEVMGTQLSLRVLGDGAICLLGGVLLILSYKLILLLAVGVAVCAMLYARWRKVL